MGCPGVAREPRSLEEQHKHHDEASAGQRRRVTFRLFTEQGPFFCCPVSGQFTSSPCPRGGGGWGEGLGEMPYRDSCPLAL